MESDYIQAILRKREDVDTMMMIEKKRLKHFHKLHNTHVFLRNFRTNQP